MVIERDSKRISHVYDFSQVFPFKPVEFHVDRRIRRLESQ